MEEGECWIRKVDIPVPLFMLSSVYLLRPLLEKHKLYYIFVCQAQPRIALVFLQEH